MADLLSKLRMLDAEPKRAPAAAAKSPGNGCYHSQAVFPLSVFCDRRHATPDLLKTVFGCEFPARLSHEDILYLDTETTGLSGGVGTIAFEIGVGYFTPSGFVVEQFLMHDYPEEAQMLTRLRTLMQRFSVICTFNGRTFDIPLLKSRFLMNRIPDDTIPTAHADVLYPARRIWKLRLKKCTLGHLEEQLLHVERDDDLPGALVPQTYFQYLKDGNFAPLMRVLEHNKQDIVSLAQLFYYLCERVARPETMQNEEDLFSLARALQKQGETQAASKCYRMSAKGAMRQQAFHAIAADEKRHGHTEAAIKLYQAMLRRGDDPVGACEALAKLYEHQLRSPAEALTYTRQALLLLSEPSLFCDTAVQQRQVALQYRYTRLRRKLSQAPTETI